MSAILVLKMVPDEQILFLLAQPMVDRLEIYFPEDYVSRDEFVDTDSAWQGIHLLLTGTLDSGTPPASFLLAGGTLLGPSALASGKDINELGLGEMDRVLTSQEVFEVKEYLETVTDEQFRQTFMESEDIIGGVYPGTWRTESEQDFSDLLLSLNSVKLFINRASQKGFGFLLHFS